MATEKKITNENYCRYAVRLLSIILKHKGVNNAIKGVQLSDILGIDTRIIAELAGLLTSEGYWVCSGSAGYWYAETEKAWDEDQLKKERDRGIASIRKTVQAKKNSVNEPTLFELGAY